MLVECPECEALNIWEPGARCADCGTPLDPDFEEEE